MIENIYMNTSPWGLVAHSPLWSEVRDGMMGVS